MTNVLAISGRLRSASINSALCRTMVHLSPPSVQVRVYQGLAHLPLCNPDLEICPSEYVGDLHSTVGAADVLVIASPEYAHGISGPMKNALDWLVSYEGMGNKPVVTLPPKNVLRS